MIRPLFFLLLVGLAGCAHSPAEDPLDPFEQVNRKVFVFNTTADRIILRPAAKAYVAVTPHVVRSGVTNFFGNLFYPTVIVNDFLQVKFVQGLQDAGRFVVNSTIGLFGLFDVAGPFLGLERHSEDLGLTLSHWGVGEGWYLMVPLLGPSTNRDLVGRIGDSFIDPFSSYADENERIAALVLSTVNGRSQYLGTDNLLDEVYDPYSFVRGAYLQRRQEHTYESQPLPRSLTPLTPE